MPMPHRAGRSASPDDELLEDEREDDADEMEDAADNGADEEEEGEPARGVVTGHFTERADGVRFRDMAIAVDATRLSTRAEGDERIPVAFSSEASVLRYDYWAGERYHEVLDHSPESVDLSYARDGLPFVLDHDLREQVGIVEEVAIDGDRRGRGMLRFSRSQRAQEIRQDILDGIRRKVSFGYRTSDDYEQTGGEGGSTPTRRYTRWTPMEVSSVAVPADYSVGYGRSATARRRRTHHTPRKGKEIPMPQPAQGAPNGATEQRELQAEYRAIRAMCRANQIDEKTEDSFLARGLSPDQVGREILEKLNARIDDLASRPPAPVLDIPQSERREFVLGRAIKAMAEGSWGGQRTYEREVSDALAQKLGRGTQGVLVPTDALGSWNRHGARDSDMRLRTPHTAGTTNNGKEMVFTEYGGFIEVLRNKSIVLNRGIVFLSGLQGNVALPRQTAAGTAAFYAENPGSDFTESNMTFDQVALSPKMIAATQSYSKQLFVQSVVAIDTLIREDLAAIIALLYDKNAIHGPGTGNTIKGIYSQTGVGTVAMGGAITFGKVVDMETTVAGANAALGNEAYITTPEIRGKAKQTALLSNTIALPLWTGSGDNGEMNGYAAHVSNQVAKNLGAGTNEHGIVYGAWNQAIGADWGAVEFVVDPLTKARQALTNITATWLVDFNLRHPEAFVKGTGLTNT